jgi:putative transposase
MIRTHVLPCQLPHAVADALNLASGQIYTSVLVTHWRVYRRHEHWLSQYGAMKLNDAMHGMKGLHAHTIDAAQEGFYKACLTTRTVRKAGLAKARFPHWRKKFRTTIWKQTAIKRRGDWLELSNGLKQRKIVITLPAQLRECLRFLEARLVYDKRARRYSWHLVVEDSQQPKAAPGDNIVSVDLGEIHPAVVGDTDEATIITCRARRHAQQGHAKRLARLTQALSRTTKGSRRAKQLSRTKARMKAQHGRVMRDLAHKISRSIVDVAVERQANTIVMGDVRDIADRVNHGKQHNQQSSQWMHGTMRTFVEYKAQAEGIQLVLQDEHYTSQTCPQCGHRYKPRGRVYLCGQCGFRGHRDVVGQINILSAYTRGAPGKLPMPHTVKHRIPHNLRVMRRCRDTGQTVKSVA